MASIPGSHITTLKPPQEYSERQLDVVCRIAHAMHRGLFVLCEPPRR
jgi:hypothetical protein